MTARARLEGLRRTLRVALVSRAVLIGLSAALLAWPLFGTVMRSALALVLAIVVGLLASSRPALRARAAGSLTNVALWVEEQTPSLRYALVTAAEGTASPLLEAQAASQPWWPDATRRVWKSLMVPAALLVLVALFAVFNPISTLTRGLAGRTPTASGSSARAVDVFSRVTATITPPAYANRRPQVVSDPTGVEALVGSRVVISGPGAATAVGAMVDSAPGTVVRRKDGWEVTLAMPARPGVVRLKAGDGRERLVVLAPIIDALPAVTLTLPAHDTIVRTGHGVVRLHADLRDDIGLRDAGFEIVISSGGGENFAFRSATLSRRNLSGAGTGALDARLSLDSLALKPGDILQMRAIARDLNNVSGPGLGASETRSLRVARPDEYDSLSIEALPPPEAETQALSQRMLINLTEALVKRQRALSREVFVGESRKLAADQRKLRKKVGDIVFQRLGSEPLSEEGSDELEGGKLTPEKLLALADSVTSTAGVVMDVEGDETPILALNKPLLEAFNAMWDAGRSLEIGEPAKALPPMRLALAAIERARLAERIYLRGRTKTPIVDIPKVRLSGKDKGKASIREARLPADSKMRRRSASFERITGLMARNPDAAADSLLLMRVDALTDSPTLAAALDEAARALRKRDTARVPLLWTRVRRALGGSPVQRAGVSNWLGAP